MIKNLIIAAGVCRCFGSQGVVNLQSDDHGTSPKYDPDLIICPWTSFDDFWEDCIHGIQFLCLFNVEGEVC